MSHTLRRVSLTSQPKGHARVHAIDAWHALAVQPIPQRAHAGIVGWLVGVVGNHHSLRMDAVALEPPGFTEQKTHMQKNRLEVTCEEEALTTCRMRFRGLAINPLMHKEIDTVTNRGQRHLVTRSPASLQQEKDRNGKSPGNPLDSTIHYPTQSLW